MASVLASSAVDNYLTAYHLPAMAAAQQLVALLAQAKPLLAAASTQYATVQTTVSANAISNFVRPLNGLALETGAQITADIAQIQALITAITTLGL